MQKKFSSIVRRFVTIVILQYCGVTLSGTNILWITAEDVQPAFLFLW